MENAETGEQRNEAPPEAAESASGPPEDGALARVRDLILRAHPDVVPELVTGATFDELLASVEPARAAYARVAARSRAATPAPIPAGQPGRQSALNLDELSASAKIAEGLRRRGARSA